MSIPIRVMNLVAYYVSGSDGWQKGSTREELIRIRDRTADKEVKDYINDRIGEKD